MTDWIWSLRLLDLCHAYSVLRRYKPTYIFIPYKIFIQLEYFIGFSLLSSPLFLSFFFLNCYPTLYFVKGKQKGERVLNFYHTVHKKNSSPTLRLWIGHVWYICLKTENCCLKIFLKICVNEKVCENTYNVV